MLMACLQGNTALHVVAVGAYGHSQAVLNEAAVDILLDYGADADAVTDNVGAFHLGLPLLLLVADMLSSFADITLTLLLANTVPICPVTCGLCAGLSSSAHCSCKLSTACCRIPDGCRCQCQSSKCTGWHNSSFPRTWSTSASVTRLSHITWFVCRVTLHCIWQL